MMFDEATSALDQATETAIMRTIREYLATSSKFIQFNTTDTDHALSLQSGRTAIFIAHRLKTIADCDEIFVLDQGKVVEHGSHDKLMHKKGLYYHMWNAQQHGTHQHHVSE